MKRKDQPKKKETGPSRNPKTICLVAFIIFSAGLFSPGMAQTRFCFIMSGQAGFPTGEFRDSIRSASGGAEFELTYSLPKSPLSVGLSLGFLIYGSETFQEFFAARNADFDLDVTTTNSIFLAHTLLRYQLGAKTIRPYLDGLVGISHLSTDTKIRDGGYYGDPVSTNNCRDTVLSYGGGIGLMVKVYDKLRPGKKKRMEVLVDARVRYIKGGRAEYLKEGSISRVGDQIYYDLKVSRTDFLASQVGIAFHF